MNYYNLAKKYIEWDNANISGVNFPIFANITKEEWNNFVEFIYKNWGITGCQKYINFIDYIRSKL